MTIIRESINLVIAILCVLGLRQTASAQQARLPWGWTEQLMLRLQIEALSRISL